MNADPERRVEENASEFDSIALDALSSGTISGKQPSAHSDDDGEKSNLQQLQNAGPSMEHVDAERIDEFCDRRRLDVAARLKLFKQVVDAVHFAHQRGIIHRDLKPGNILVRSDGVPSLINFGNVRRAHDGCEDGAEAALASEYASPEQVMGDTITTASDIYSLGVILYELLTGRRPYRLKTADSSEVAQAICEQVPEKLSQVAVLPGISPEQLKRALRGDLDSIILTAMRKEPDGRYPSADHFANDLERYLDGSAVCAHRGSAVYRSFKFMRRHAVAVLISGALLSALIAGAVASVAGLILARRERDRAEGSFRQARQAVDQFFTRVSQEKLLNQPGLDPLRNALLADAQAFYEEFLSKRSDDRSMGVEIASARTHLAQISSVTGSATEAVSKFQQAIALWEGLVATQPTNVVYREALARALNEQGAVILHMKDRGALALRIFRRALNLLEPQVAASHSPAASHELSMILLNIGEAEREEGQLKEAIESIQRSLAIEGELVTQGANLLDSSISMAKGHALLGQIFASDSDEIGPALMEYQQAIALLEKVTKLRPDLPGPAFELAFIFNDLSHLQQMAGKLDSALGSAGKAMDILERLDRQYPTGLNYQQGLAGIYHLMSDLHRGRREPAEALAFAQKAQALLGRQAQLHPENVNLRLDLAESQNNLGRMLQQTGEPVDALRSFQRAIDIYESIPELDPRDSYHLACNIALSIRLIGVKNGSEDTVALSKLSKADLLRRERYSERAIELLRRAVREGPLEFDVDVLQSDTDLDALRDLPDFQRLLDEIDGKTTGGK